jgi:hypothetical protein
VKKKDIITLEPVEGANQKSLLGKTVLRFYESSIKGMVSVTMRLIEDTYNGGFVLAGTRLTEEQVVELHDALSAHLSEVGLLHKTQLWADGYEVGEQNGYDRGYGDGYSDGDFKGRQDVLSGLGGIEGLA